jgi:hypothetical protein
MEGSGAIPMRAMKCAQARSYSDQVVHESTAALDVHAERLDDGSLQKINASLKRACSLPPIHHTSSDGSISSSTSTFKSSKPSFKIILPSVDLSRISAALKEHRTHLNKAFEALAKTSVHHSVLDSPVFETQALVRRDITSLVTPPDEQTEFSFQVSPEDDSLEGEALTKLITEWGGHIRTPSIDEPEGQPETGDSDSSQETPKPELATPTNSHVTTSAGEATMSGSQPVQDDENDDQTGHWLEEVLEKAGIYNRVRI